MSKISTRDKIFDAALHLFVQEGLAAPVNKLVAKTGIAKGTFYHHFSSKEQLITELYQKLMFEIEAECVAGYDQEGAERYSRNTFSSIVKWFITHPRKFRYIVIFEASPYHNQKNATVDKVMDGPIKNIMQKVNMGVLKANPPNMIAYMDFGFTRAMAGYFLSFNDPIDQFHRQFGAAFDMYWLGVSNQ